MPAALCPLERRRGDVVGADSRTEHVVGLKRPRSSAAALPPCYALVFAGLEPIAADEICADQGGEIKRTARGVVVFRVPEIDRSLLQLRTVEDVFLLAWG